jgi:hypothetical protein
MKKTSIHLFGTLLVSAFTALGASADMLNLSGSLPPAYALVEGTPYPVGEAAMGIDPETRTFNLTINIVGLNSPMTAAYMQVEDGPSIVDLPTAQFNGDENLMVGVFGGTFPSADLGDLLAGNVFVMIETEDQPEGEIRGSLGLEADAGNQLLNFSCRGMVNPGNGKAGILIGGFVVGEGGETVLMRCIGDGLTKWGLKSLKDTALQVYDINGDLVGENDNWKDNGQEFAILSTGFAPDRDSDAALILDLPAGAYTVHGDSNKGAGIALVDMYGVETKTVAATISAAAHGTESAEFTVLNQALIDTGLDSLLNGPGPFTVFAPTDEAFASAGSIADLEDLLKTHIVAAYLDSTQLEDGILVAINGAELTVDTTGGIMVNNAAVIGADLGASNGIIHVLDQVLVP